ncbi:quinone oxidoreductase family protein, partial [Streptomyces fragilis]|uniref:Zinc-binding dehydrogenase n=2 Tax=Streptomyces fragilis TaxID=67301 RepID=A0ABV2YJE2_9ACTN
MLAIQFDRFGGPEVLTPVDIPAPVPGPGEVLITVEAAGVNLADTFQTDGTYLDAAQLPHIPGTEVVGRTPDGQRVLAKVTHGYAEQVVCPHTAITPIPEQLPAPQALALLTQGLTAWHLLRTAARIRPGETVVVHSAAGGVGNLAVQLAKHFGAGHVLAQASTPAKEHLALQLGADDIARYPLTQPADIILDAAGGTLFDHALQSLNNFGRLITYGNASRTPHTPIDPTHLTRLNAAVIGFWLRPTLTQPHHYTHPLQQLLHLTHHHQLHPHTTTQYPLTHAHHAHTHLRQRLTTGKITLHPH